MRILDRLVAGSFLKMFLAFAVGAPFLFILGDVTQNLDDYLAKGLTPAQVVLAYLYMFPQYLQWSFPISSLVGSVFTVQRMTVHREIVAAKAGGISFQRLVTPLVALGFLLAGAALALEEVVPRTNRIAGQILRGEDPRREFRNDFVFQARGGKNLAVRGLNVPGSYMTGVVMESLPLGRDRPTDHLVAEIARYSPETGWTFGSGHYRIFSETGEEVVFRFTEFQTRGLEERPEDLVETPPKPEEMTYREMGRLAEIMFRSGGNPRKILVDQQKKLAIPAATLVIVLFGAPLATSTKRGGTTFGIGLALLAVILYLLLFRITEALGDTGALSPLHAAWLPNLIFLAVGAAAMLRVRT